MTNNVIVPLLGSLFDRGRQFVATPKGAESDEQVYHLLQDKAGGVVVEFLDIEKMILAGKEFSTTESIRHIRLPDIEEGGARITPLAYLDGHLRSQSPYLRLQVILVIHANATTQVAKRIALRFETPEASGKHSYYHSQICVGIQRGGGTNTMDMELELPWFPASHPAWPMDAETPAELLVCLILSLYGKAVGWQIINEAGLRCGRDLFEEVLGGMRTKFRDAPSSTSRELKKKNKSKKSKKR